MRERMPDDRKSRTLHFSITDDKGDVTDGYLHAGLYEDGRLGEIFLKIAKPANPVLEQWAILFSVALQNGVAVDALCDKFIATRFEPSGSCTPATAVTSDERKMAVCTSPLDLVCRYLKKNYGNKDKQHTTDADCQGTLDAEGQCLGCGVSHGGAACTSCGGVAFHTGECTGVEGYNP